MSIKLGGRIYEVEEISRGRVFRVQDSPVILAEPGDIPDAIREFEKDSAVLDILEVFEFSGNCNS